MSRSQRRNDEEQVSFAEVAAGTFASIFPCPILLLLLFLLILAGTTTAETSTGTIVSVSWERSFRIEEDKGQKRTNWQRNPGSIIWEKVSEPKSTGADRSPVWPESELEDNQRINFRQEYYRIYIEDPNKKVHTYTITDEVKWKLYNIGDRVTIDLNGFGSVNGIAVIGSETQIEPKQR